MYDIIGDIHGYCSKLEELLIKMGYEKRIVLGDILIEKQFLLGTILIVARK